MPSEIARSSTRRHFDAEVSTTRPRFSGASTLNGLANFSARTRESGSFLYRTVLSVNKDGRAIPLPIMVEVRRTPTQVSVAHLETGIFGVGTTESDAARDFLQSLVVYRDELARTKNLSPSLKVLLAFLAAHT